MSEVQFVSTPQGFKELRKALAWRLLNEAQEVEVATWHAKPVKGEVFVTREIMDLALHISCPRTMGEAQELVQPNLPWAEDHFQERVSGYPLNPPPSHKYWPFGNTEAHQTEEKFSHSYPERMWPDVAWNQEHDDIPYNVTHGIRYNYGNLMDVMELLREDRYTRQAYLPMWFPEDTGNVMHERVPCSLGWHFLYRKGLSMRYYIRSVDFVRHFQDDAYMSLRLLQWTASQLDQVGDEVIPTYMLMHISSLHAMNGDKRKLEQWAKA